MSAKPEAVDSAKPPAKSKKMLIIIIAAALVLVLGGGGAFFYIKKQQAAAAEGTDGEEAAPAKAAAHADPGTPPVYLPVENLVVNLADPGGEKVAQIGLLLVVADAKTSDTVKAYLPSIRSGILKQLTRRTAAELLSPEGKDQLEKDVLREASIPFGGGEDDPEEEEATTTKKKSSKKKKAHVEYPVTGVEFSNYIVQ